MFVPIIVRLQKRDIARLNYLVNVYELDYMSIMRAGIKTWEDRKDILASEYLKKYGY